MKPLPTRQAFIASSQRVRRLEGVWWGVGVAPALIDIVLPQLGGVPDMFKSLNERAGAWLPAGIVLWAFAIMVGSDQLLHRRAGLLCGSCGLILSGSALEVVVSAGACGRCGARVLRRDGAGDA